MALGAAISAAFTVAAVGLMSAATQQGIEWALPAAVILGVIGGAVGAGLAAYKAAEGSAS